jgi:predicted lipoprotein with Yx(FWY)xxD motif
MAVHAAPFERVVLDDAAPIFVTRARAVGGTSAAGEEPRRADTATATDETTLGGMTATPTRAAVLAAALVLVAAACGSSSKTVAPPPASTATSTTPVTSPVTSTTARGGSSHLNLGKELAAVGAAAPSSFTVSLAKGPQGIFEVGPNGHALYFRPADNGAKSTCTGTCASIWPAITASGPVTAGPAVSTAELAKVDGQVPNQVTYFGHLLYYFSGDSAPGQTNGVGKPGWFLLGPVGNQMSAR